MSAIDWAIAGIVVMAIGVVFGGLWAWRVSLKRYEEIQLVLRWLIERDERTK